jgi:DNA-binding response OmpR family regulator
MSVSPFDRLGRDAGLIGPVLLLAEQSDQRLVRTRSVLRLHRVATVEMQDAMRGRAYLAVRQSPLLVVVPTTPSWAVSAVAALRAASDAPLVVCGLTPSSDEMTELLGVGATIVIGAGVRERELSARIGALYHVVRPEPRDAARWLEAPGLRLDLFSKTVEVDGEPVRLSRNEYRLLVFLMSRAQQTIAPEDIVRGVWQWSYGDGKNTLRLHVARLRRKLGDDARKPRFLASLRGAGYRFVEPVAEIGDGKEAGEETRENVLSARLDSLYAILDAVGSVRSVAELGERATAAMVASSACDAASLFRYEHDQSRATLVATEGTSGRWKEAMRDGHSLCGDFVGGQAGERGEEVQVADIRRSAKRFPGSAPLLSADRLRSCLVMPLRVNGEIWGDIGYVKRQPRAFTPEQATYLRSVSSVIEMKLAAVGD